MTYFLNKGQHKWQQLQLQLQHWDRTGESSYMYRFKGLDGSEQNIHCYYATMNIYQTHFVELDQFPITLNLWWAHNDAATLSTSPLHALINPWESKVSFCHRDCGDAFLIEHYFSSACTRAACSFSAFIEVSEYIISAASCWWRATSVYMRISIADAIKATNMQHKTLSPIH